ncbi:uncharacterized protein LOC119666542 [Teleopsis dalmanni]|uniref:uncharacterized protein LOC119666542 n=1 Tax=Teleopsis dalmanni TaxID=139649 RepID=UPI0018CDD638|nr:uncharacterized protein LOC119666542 [Teleopsis dalmanni]
MLYSPINFKIEYVEQSEYEVYPKYLNLDLRKVPDEPTLIESAGEELPTVPFSFWYQNSVTLMKPDNSTCAKYATPFEITYYNTYWQTYKTANLTFQIFGAYYDIRPELVNGPVVRILVMVDQIDLDFPSSYCQLWFEGQNDAVIVNVTDYRPIWNPEWYKAKHIYFPHLLTCILPVLNGNAVPKAVSLVDTKCSKASNTITIYYDPLPKDKVRNGFAVCVKNLFFPIVDHSARVVEWLELLRLLGVTKVYMYDLYSHPNLTKVLNYYEEDGFVEVTPITHANGEPQFPHYYHLAWSITKLSNILHELIAYNDCFYKHMYRYDYIALIDTDEVLMPLDPLSNWHDIVEVVRSAEEKNRHNFTNICFRNVYFPEYSNLGRYTRTIPEYFYMLQHVKRVEKHLDPRLAIKCLHDTQKVVTLHNHMSRSCFHNCSRVNIDIKNGQLHHYREPDIKKTLDTPVVDTSIWRFKKQLIKRSMRVFQKLKFF